MIVFLIAAALLSAATVALVIYFAGREPQAAGSDPAAAVYRRQLDEIDELADRGVLADDERKAARAEAGRRLLGAGEGLAEAAATKPVRMAILAAGVGAAVVALGVYFVIGAPGRPDQPFKRRAAEWMRIAEKEEGRGLNGEQIAVVLKAKVKENPDNSQLLFFLADTQIKIGQIQAGIHNLRRVAELAPGQAEVWEKLGEALTTATTDQTVPPEAVVAFNKALALDPKSIGARYFIGQSKMDAGNKEAGLADWRQLLAEAPPGSEPAKALQGEIDRVEGRAPAKLAANDPQSSMIAGMVASLAEKLKQNPNDAAGWQRLIRSYAVLGDTAKMNAALEQARRIFKDKPSERAAIEAAADKPQGAE